MIYSTRIGNIALFLHSQIFELKLLIIYIFAEYVLYTYYYNIITTFITTNYVNASRKNSFLKR
jgi:hypothetical protein